MLPRGPLILWLVVVVLGAAAPVAAAPATPGARPPNKRPAPPPTKRTVPRPSNAALRRALERPRPRPRAADRRSGIQSRLEFLVRHLDAGRGRLRAWWIAWLTTYGALAVGQAVAIAVVPEIFQDRDTVHAMQKSLALNASASLLGAIAVAIAYPPSMSGSRSVRALQDGTPEGDARALARAEQLVRGTADKQRFGRSWLRHVGGAVISVAAGLVNWLAFHRPVEGGLTMGVGTALTQAQIWTQPMDAVRAWKAYRARFAGDRPTAGGASLQGPSWSFVPHPGGLGLQITW